MNGANAGPCVKIINASKSIKKIMIGASHHFLRTLENYQNSLIIDILLIFASFLNHSISSG